MLMSKNANNDVSKDSPGKIIASARFFIRSSESDKYCGNGANTTHAYSSIERTSEQYTMTLSCADTPHRLSCLKAESKNLVLSNELIKVELPP